MLGDLLVLRRLVPRSSSAEQSQTMRSEIADCTYDDSRSPESIGDVVQIAHVTGNYFFSPTPSDNNNAGVDNVGSRRVPQNAPD